jgi:hypothetical protein
MHKPKPQTIVSWVRHVGRTSDDAQVAAHLAHGVPVAMIVVDGRKVGQRRPEDWAYLLKKVRPGDVLAVTTLRTLIMPRPRETPHHALVRALHEVETAGAVDVVEIGTGRRTSLPRDRDTMIADAVAAHKRGDVGRPPQGWAEAGREIIERHWHSTRHATNADALAAIREDARAAGLVELARLRNPQSIGNRFGPSGRAGKSKPKKR